MSGNELIHQNGARDWLRWILLTGRAEPIDGILEAEIDGILEALIDGIMEVLIDGIMEAPIDGIMEAPIDGIMEAPIDGIMEALIDGRIDEIGSDHMQGMAGKQDMRPRRTRALQNQINLIIGSRQKPSASEQGKGDAKNVEERAIL